MSTKMEENIKRWTAKRKSALVLDIIQGKTTVSEASRQYDLSPSEVEQWVDDVKRGDGECLACQSFGYQGTARAPANGSTGSDARDVAVVWVPNGGLAAGVRQEHPPAYLPD